MNLDNSRIAEVLETLAEKSAVFGQHSVIVSTVGALGTRASTFIRGSYCYRWLTKEPEPDIIVIDLQKTRTVGPFIRLLEKIIDPVERAWAGSYLSSVTTDVGEAISGSRTGRVLVALLEPPEPPANDTDEKTE